MFLARPYKLDDFFCRLVSTDSLLTIKTKAAAVAVETNKKYTNMNMIR